MATNKESNDLISAINMKAVHVWANIDVEINGEQMVDKIREALLKERNDVLNGPEVQNLIKTLEKIKEDAKHIGAPLAVLRSIEQQAAETLSGFRQVPMPFDFVIREDPTMKEGDWRLQSK